MKLSLFANLFRNIGLALAQPLLKRIVIILLSIGLAIVYPLAAIAQTAPVPSVKVTPTPQPAATKKDPPAQPAPKQEQAKSGGPYDVKTIQESYKSLYGS